MPRPGVAPLRAGESGSGSESDRVPFDGLTVSSKNYENAHVLVEAYPSALRDAFVAQSDEADALCTVEALRMADAEGRLGPLLDVAGIPERLQAAVRFEGWIFGQEI